MRSIALLCLFPSALSLLATIRNDVPRVDQFGHIVNAHDGSVVFFDGIYYMYGTVYENCTQPGTQCAAPCGYSPNTFALYTSPDLMSWTLHSTDILPEMTKDNKVVDYWMPVVARNPTTGMYVMQYWSGRCGFAKPCADIATATTPEGPFTMVPPLALTAVPSSQMGFFFDAAAGRAYVKYNTGAPQHHVIQALADDWLSTTSDYAILFWQEEFAWKEGGGLFRRGDLYYYMTGTDCCFCTWGGSAQFWTARAALGPWHPGVAPPLPSALCDVSGGWVSVSGSGEEPGNETLTLAQAAGSANFTFQDAHGQATGWLEAATGYVHFPPSAGDGRGVITSADGTAAGCDRIRWYGYDSFIWCRAGVTCTQPAASRDAPELNLCADGSVPAYDVRVNPCDPGVERGTNFTVPAQQFNVIEAHTQGADGAAGTTILYYGERANSAPDRLFSHNFQAWVPLSFDSATGAILRMDFPPSFTLNLTDATGAASRA